MPPYTSYQNPAYKKLSINLPQYQLNPKPQAPGDSTTANRLHGELA